MRPLAPEKAAKITGEIRREIELAVTKGFFEGKPHGKYKENSLDGLVAKIGDTHGLLKATAVAQAIFAYRDAYLDHILSGGTVPEPKNEQDFLGALCGETSRLGRNIMGDHLAALINNQVDATLEVELRRRDLKPSVIRSAIFP